MTWQRLSIKAAGADRLKKDTGHLTHPGIFSSGSEKGVDLFRPYVSVRGIPVRMADIFGKILQVTERTSLKTTGETR